MYLDATLDRIINHHINAGNEKKKILELMAMLSYENENETGILRSDGRNFPEEFYYNVISQLGMNDSVLYEQEGLEPIPSSAFHYDLPLTHNNVVSKFNEGYGAVFWSAHSGETTAYRKYWAEDENSDGIPQYSEIFWKSFLNSGDDYKLSRNHLAFVFQMSCSNGFPENSDNLGFALLKRGAAIATVSSSRVGWYATGNWSSLYYSATTDGIGLGFNFLKKLIKENLTASQAFYETKCLGGDDWGGTSWANKMTFNLYGDPHINYWGSEQPTMSSPFPGNNQTVSTYNNTLSIKVFDPDNDPLNVAFYDANTSNLIGVKLGVSSGSKVSISLPSDYNKNNIFWFVIVCDGQVISQSEIWSFTIDKSLPIWGIILISVGSILLIGGIAVVLYVFVIKKK